MGELTRGDGVALHAQLTALLAEGVQNGTYPQGSNLPSEAELQKTHGVARSVVRQALAGLVTMGLIERIKGSGSRVTASTRYHRLAQSRMGLAAQLSGAGSVTTTAVLTFERLGERTREFDDDASGTLHLERLRAVDGQPIAVIQTWLPLPLADSLTAEELTDASLHAAMHRRYGSTFSGGTRQVRALGASRRLAGLLGVEPGVPLLLLEGLTTDDAGHVVEKFATWHRGDLISLDFSL